MSSRFDPIQDEESEARVWFRDIVDETTPENVDEYDVTLLGQPYDGGHILGRPGARKGPEALRKAMANTRPYHIDNGSIDLAIGDVGNLRVPSGESNTTAHEALMESAAELHDADTFPLFLGGDHSIAHPNAAPLLSEYDSVGVINLDSHADLMELIGGQPHTASPFLQLYEDGLESYTILGARGFGLGENDIDIMAEHGDEPISAEEVSDDPDAAAERALELMDGVDAIYVTLDIDVLDLSFAPGTSSPYPGGILPRELFRIVRQLGADERVVGFELVECLPQLDWEQVPATTTNGGRAICHFLSGFAEQQ